MTDQEKQFLSFALKDLACHFRKSESLLDMINLNSKESVSFLRLKHRLYQRNVSVFVYLKARPRSPLSMWHGSIT